MDTETNVDKKEVQIQKYRFSWATTEKNTYKSANIKNWREKGC